VKQQLATAPMLDFLKAAGVVAFNANSSNTVVRACDPASARAGTYGQPGRGGARAGFRYGACERCERRRDACAPRYDTPSLQKFSPRLRRGCV
jgi:hypothetical protein